VVSSKDSIGIFLVAAVLAAAAGLRAQSPPSPAQSARSDARFDITGTWVSIVTEDWRWRMVTPAAGDYASVPLTPEGRRVADLWDPAKDESSGNQCRAYGVGGIMRRPGRLRIGWQDNNILKIETDAGTQTRLLRFGAASAGNGTWQGASTADWQGRRAEGNPRADDGGLPRSSSSGLLHVRTTGMRPGYLRRNGVPYSANAVVTEYFTRSREESGDEWLVVTTIVEDPQYLVQPFVTSSHFKKEADDSKWSPTPCAAQ
jgi:hypothetical protein